MFDNHSKKDPIIKFWLCERKNDCKACIHTTDDVVITKINEHLHGTSVSSVEISAIKTSLKRRAKECQDQSSTVINLCSENIYQAAQGELPNTDSMRQMVKRRTNQLNLAPLNIADVSEIAIPDEYKQYMMKSGERENFLIADSGQSDDRILIFERESWTKHLLDSGVWYADGTFRLAPPLFTQVYVILAKKHGGVHPILYALLPNKRRATYVCMFQLLHDKNPRIESNSNFLWL